MIAPVRVDVCVFVCIYPCVCTWLSNITQLTDRSRVGGVERRHLRLRWLQRLICVCLLLLGSYSAFNNLKILIGLLAMCTVNVQKIQYKWPRVPNVECHPPGVFKLKILLCTNFYYFDRRSFKYMGVSYRLNLEI